jgi:ABC-type phosphate transport system permease subunit
MRWRAEKAVERVLQGIAFSALASLLLIAVFIFKEGVPFILSEGPSRFLLASEWQPQAGKFGIYPMIVSSLWVTFGAMVIGAPFGVAGAVFLSEFCSPAVRRIVKPTVELLAGIPSVVYGFMGVVVLAPMIRGHLGGPGLSVLAAAVAQLLITLATGSPAPTVGASGALFGLLMAYGLLFPHRTIMPLFPPIPMKARTFVIVFGGLELGLGLLGHRGIAHFAHLGGMLGGWLMIQYWRRRGPWRRR